MTKLDWGKKDPDEPLYNAMIWALSIGIVVVIVTLFLTRPAPESFSELYFNNHTLLPEYINLNIPYPYSFTIHNLENENTTYNYTTSVEYYGLDYSCDKPQLYLESIDQSRITSTNDPALYIKESEYSIGFNYELKIGNRVALSLIDINGSTGYSIILDHGNNKIYYMEDNTLTPINITTNTSKIHTFRMQVNNTITKISLDQDSFILNTSKKSGFIQLETVNTYAEFTNFNILRNTTTENVAIQLADAVYTNYPLNATNNTLAPNTSINLTNYNIQATFRTYSTITLQLRPTTAITYDTVLGNVVVNDSNDIEKYYVDPAPISDLSANVNNKSIDIYYNDEFITSIDNTNTTLTPKIMYNNVTVNSFYVKANDAPITINYALTQAKQTTQGLLTVNSLKYFNGGANATLQPTIDNVTQGLSVDEASSLQDYFDASKISTTNYRITTMYTDRDRNHNLSVALVGLNNTVYKIEVNNENKTAIITYYINKTLAKAVFNITPLITNRLVIDVKNSTLTINLNNKNIFSKIVDKSTNGSIIYDNNNITIGNAQLEDRTTGSITVFQREVNINCDPILLNKYIYNNSVTIADKDNSTINDSVTFNQTFDIAKVQVTLDNNQEIHYWVKLI